MKIKYEFVTETVEIEVTAEWAKGIESLKIGVSDTADGVDGKVAKEFSI